MKTVLSAAILALGLAIAQPAVAKHSMNPEEAVWVPLSEVTADQVDRFFKGEFGDIVIVIEKGDTLPFSLDIEGGILSTDSGTPFRICAEHELYIYIRGAKPHFPLRFSLDGKKWYPARRLFTGKIDTKLDGASVSVGITLQERENPDACRCPEQSFRECEKNRCKGCGGGGHRGRGRPGKADLPSPATTGDLTKCRTGRCGPDGCDGDN